MAKPRRQNVERSPWYSLIVRLSENEVAAIATRGVVPGRIAVRLLEAIALECDHGVRYRHGRIVNRPRQRRQK